MSQRRNIFKNNSSHEDDPATTQKIFTDFKQRYKCAKQASQTEAIVDERTNEEGPHR